MAYNKKYIKNIEDTMINLLEKASDEDKYEIGLLYKELMKERTSKFGITPDFSKMTIREKIYPGMYYIVLLTTDILTIKRWKYWMEVLYTNDISKDIPQVSFSNVHSNEGREVVKMLKNCIDVPYTSGPTAFTQFVNYLLYCILPLEYHKGETIEDKLKEAENLIAGIDDRTLQNYYENFSLESMLLHPGDYLGDIAAEYLGSNGTEYFPTPHHVVELMVAITMGDGDKSKLKSKAVCDPCCGSSRMLVYASNYSLNLMGQDISKIMCDISTLNGFLYVPWLVFSSDTIKEVINKENEKLEEKEFIIPSLENLLGLDEAELTIENSIIEEVLEKGEE